VSKRQPLASPTLTSVSKQTIEIQASAANVSWAGQVSIARPPSALHHVSKEDALRPTLANAIKAGKGRSAVWVSANRAKTAFALLPTSVYASMDGKDSIAHSQLVILPV